jgi:hypothetical protein
MRVTAAVRRSGHRLAPGLLLAALLAAPARAQDHAHDHDGHGGDATVAAAHADPTAAAADGAMSGGISAAGSHMRLTDRRPGTAADSARAATVLAELRQAIAKYADVRAAERDGFKQFAPGLRNQRVYHFTHGRNAFREHFRFDPAKPTSLLYRRDSTGSFRLLGAMYVAPKRAAPAELDARVPLGIAQWHAHTNICVPRRRPRERWREMEDGQMRFGPAGAIATKEACDAAGGRFFPQLFGWMVHVNAFADDPADVWRDDHRTGGAGGHAH